MVSTKEGKKGRALRRSHDVTLHVPRRRQRHPRHWLMPVQLGYSDERRYLLLCKTHDDQRREVRGAGPAGQRESDSRNRLGCLECVSRFYVGPCVAHLVFSPHKMRLVHRVYPRRSPHCLRNSPCLVHLCQLLFKPTFTPNTHPRTILWLACLS